MEKSIDKFRRKEVLDAKEPLVVVGIPAYNEEKTIAKVVLQARKVGDIVVVCDDGSSDMTSEIAEGLGAAVVRHEKNLGYGAAIQSLFRQAKRLNADVLVTLDGDGQHDVNDISGLLKPILDGGADIVTGSRFVSKTENGNNHIPWHRRLGIKMITKLTRSASGCDVSDAQNGLRAYNRTALERLMLGESGMGVSVEILVKAKERGLRLAETPVVCNYSGVEQPSTHNSFRQGTSVVTSIVRLVVEERPLVFLGVPGVVSLLTGALFGIWMLQIYAVEHRIVTNIALASIAFTMIGLFSIFTSITLYGISRVMQKKQTTNQ